MKQIGVKLCEIRHHWGLTLREVESRSGILSNEWKKPSFRISASWLNRVEREGRGLSIAKFVVLTIIYRLRPEQLLALCPSEPDSDPMRAPFSGPNSTLLLEEGPLDEQARSWLPVTVATDSAPDATSLIESGTQTPDIYRRGIIGRRDKTMAPMIRAGSVVLINTQRRAIAQRKEWTNEFDRPIYFLFTRAGYACGWCELDSSGEWLTLVPHPLSYAPSQRWRYRREVEVVGRVSAVLVRLEEAQSA